MTPAHVLIALTYVIVFLAGFVAAMQTGIFKNSAQIRRNSETIRRQAEAELNQRTKS